MKAEKETPVLSHTFVLEDLEFTVLRWDGEEQMVRGSPVFIDELRNQPNEWVVWFRVTLVRQPA